jgi:hypothetical protein
MHSVGKGIATAAVWIGVCVLVYLFHSFEMLSVVGAICLVAIAVILTAGLWKINLDI